MADQGLDISAATLMPAGVLVICWQTQKGGAAAETADGERLIH